MTKRRRIAIVGAGNIGTLIATGLTRAKRCEPRDVTLTRRKTQHLEALAKRGFNVTSDNRSAVKSADVVIVAVEPQQLDGALREIATSVKSTQTIISVVSDATIAQIKKVLKKKVPVVRAMPNTAIAIRESMTCLASEGEPGPAMEVAQELFDAVGKTLIIDEEQMTAATALGACGVAFFLRAIRSASQGGIEIGFHAEQALLIAAQTARGAASLLAAKGNHPEHEIDRVTTPRGCTIAGLNQMEHGGFSSALIRGIVTSAEKAGRLYKKS